MQKVLVTGAAGFLGMHTSAALARQGYEVIGIDFLGPLQNPKLKEDRLSNLRNYSDFEFQKLDLCKKNQIQEIMRAEKFDYVIHLAAQAGVRNGVEFNDFYIQSNITAFYHLLEAIRLNPVKNFLFASSSSVYGKNSKLPFVEDLNTSTPVSLYAATKIANEAMAHSYSHLYKIPTIGMRFFTVYGPWGRPDMAPFLFAHAIYEERPLDLFNAGEMRRDFTYVDDVVAAITKLLKYKNKYSIFNVGNSSPVHLKDFLSALEKAIGKNAKLNNLPMHPSDVLETFADVALLEKEVDFRPHTTLGDGVAQFIKWFKDYYAY